MITLRHFVNIKLNYIIILHFPIFHKQTYLLPYNEERQCNVYKEKQQETNNYSHLPLEINSSSLLK